MLSNKEFLSDRLPTQNGHGKVLTSSDQEGKLILLRIHLKFTLYFAVKLTFPEFHFETEAKVDFPSPCI